MKRILWLLGTWFCWIIAVYAELPSANPFYLEAEQVIYDHTTKTIIATGAVHIRQYSEDQKGWRHIYADEVKYQQFFNSTTSSESKGKEPKGKITASGNVWLQDPSGDVWQTNFLDFHDTFDQGGIGPLLLVTKDNSRLSALNSHKINTQTYFRDAHYSPCKVCAIDPCRPEDLTQPLWQITAKKVTHDQEQQKVIYHHARLEIKGIPVFYLPYFSHPDPKVKRKSGILFPIYGVSQDLGLTVSLPVYYVIAPNRDLTLTPIITAKQGGVLAGEYRHRFYDGEAKIAGSYTHSHTVPKLNSAPALNGPRPPHQDRWHLAAQTRYDMNDKQRLWIDINKASDTTYLTRYPINRQTSNFIQNKNLTSTVTFERFDNASYFGTRAFSFQTDTPKTTPFVVPLANFHHQRDPDRLGGILSFEGSFLSLTRQLPVIGQQATQVQRLSSGIYWKLPYATSSGHLVTIRLSTRADGYYTRHYQQTLQTSAKAHPDQTTGRFFPQASVDWRYPLIAHMSYASWLLQPMATLITSPTHLNSRRIPNEDSTIFELDDTNLFHSNRFNGIDRTDSGHRMVYGVDNDFSFSEQRHIGLFLGQSRRLDHNQVVPNGFGEDHKQSDYIGRLKIKPVSWLSGRYRIALKPQNAHFRYSELGMCLGEKHLKLDIGYVYLNKMANVQGQDISQINWQLSTQVIEKWSLSFAQIKNLKKSTGGNSLASFILASYKDECFQLDAGLYKTSYRDRDIRPDSGVLVQCVFKNLGSFVPLTAPKYPGSMLTSF